MFLLKASVTFLAILAYEANATFTIVAVDTEENYIGAAGATCVPQDGFSIYNALYHSVVGEGILVAQGLLQQANSSAITMGLSLLSSGTAPDQIVLAITDPDVDSTSTTYGNVTFPENTLRQYGIVDFTGLTAGYTGGNLSSLYQLTGDFPSEQTDVQFNTSDGRFAATAQGNVVVEGTVAQLETGFIGQSNPYVEGCDLADRLFQAVNSVNASGLGDSRCTTKGLPAGAVAFIHVEDIDGTVILHVDIPFDASNPADPFDGLQAGYNSWRDSNPCPLIASRPTSTPGSTSESMSPTSVPVSAPTKSPSTSMNSSGGSPAVAAAIHQMWVLFGTTILMMVLM